MLQLQNISVDYVTPHVVKISLNRERQANSLSLALLEELQNILTQINEESNTRVVILTGAGEKAFCAGADLKERAGMNEEQVRHAVSMIRTTMEMVEQLPQPVIAAINGIALGGGTELSLACDFRIAAESASLGLTETTLAIIPGAGGTQRLPRLIGVGRAKELIYTGRRISAQEAKEYGLVEFVVPPHLLEEKAIEIAEKIASNGPIAVRLAKEAISNGIQVDLHTGLQMEKQAYEGVIHTKDRLEGLQAFKEKRTPMYKGE
ncbi:MULTISPECIES: enoyl-CoA hydratase [Bacillus]|uniref:enoyl-CoA hydratase n=1 Tax=Bacillus TaxID=1386 RepID=UPI0008FDA84E|nr:MULTISPECIES: enoyl-CoA hydratase [Bacillus]AXO98549.1 enoyl-CoA hydratase [Bacillus anthracis]MDA1526156.1 enoyl-CoA hydratase [Bacillus cereus]MDA2311480.1 enoyl-CoA hydratase [Bacillus cereus]MDA2316032.1 enoyl-CoA hydratase [Bacillus cereus]MDA2500387.1 enoyl-CoA hydratase [Bacillus cereus]